MFPLARMVDFWGTRSQLEDEGLIPAGFVWPYSGQEASWRVGGIFEYTEYKLHRVPPADFAGLRSEWLAMDNWRLRVSASWRRAADCPSEPASPAAPAAGGAAAVRTDWDLSVWYVAAQRDRRFRRVLEALLPPKKRRSPNLQAPAPNVHRDRSAER